MKLKELRALIKDLPDDIEVFVPGNDHNYCHANVSQRTALAAYDDPKYFYEDYGDEHKDDEKDKRVHCLVIH